jgi:hypothetical protein
MLRGALSPLVSRYAAAPLPDFRDCPAEVRATHTA